MKPTSAIHEKIGAELQGFGGHTECTVCGYTLPLGNVGFMLSDGWPKCHGYTMTWVTRRQELERLDSKEPT
jgi:hypothetical protein